MAKTDFTDESGAKTVNTTSLLNALDPVRRAWSYKVADNYLDGCESGAAAAIAYLQFTKNRADRLGGSFLQTAALYFADELNLAQTKEQRSAMRGKIVGFFIEIERWVAFAVKRATSDSMEMSAEAITALLDKAAAGGAHHAWEAAIKKSRSDQARAAANARWAKRKLAA